MEFIDKSGFKSILYLKTEQNLEMWEKGWITVHDGEWVYYRKMKDLIPVFKMDLDLVNIICPTECQEKKQ